MKKTNRNQLIALFCFLLFVGMLSGCTLLDKPSNDSPELGTPPAETGVVKQFTPNPLAAVSMDLPKIDPSLNTASSLVWLEGDRFAVVGDEEIALLDASPTQTSAQSLPELQAVQPSNNSRLLTASHMGADIAWVSQDSQIEFWRPDENKAPMILKSADTSITGLTLSGDGALMAYAALDGSVAGIFAQTQNDAFAWTAPAWLSNLSISPDGKLLAGVDLPNFLVYIYNIDGSIQKNLQWSEHASPALYSANFSPDWSRIAWVARGTVQLMDVESGVLGAQLSHEDFVTACVWSADSRMVATAAPIYSGDKLAMGIFIWDPASGNRIDYFEIAPAVRSLAFSPDSKRIAVLDDNGVLQMFEISS